MPDGPGFQDFEMEYFKPLKHKLGNTICIVHSLLSSHIPEIECHAEVNAIVSAFRRQADLSESTLYVTHSPCSGCCKLIHQSGIKKVVWANEYDEKVEEHMKPICEDAKW